MFNVIVTHRGCPDGSLCAYIAKEVCPEAMILPLSNGDPLPLEHISGTVLFTDFSPRADQLDGLMEACEQLYVIDHHQIDELKAKIATSAYGERIILAWDNTIAACQATWDILHPGEERPWYVDYVGDRDNGNFSLLNWKEINTGMYEANRLWFGGIRQLENETEQLGDVACIEKYRFVGEVTLKKQDFLVNLAVRGAQAATFISWDGPTYQVLVVTCTKNLLMDVCERLFKETPDLDFVVWWQYRPKERVWKFSLRGSGKDSEGKVRIDLSLICNQFINSEGIKGGGHPNAAGFMLNELNPFIVEESQEDGTIKRREMPTSFHQVISYNE